VGQLKDQRLDGDEIEPIPEERNDFTKKELRKSGMVADEL